MINKNLSAPAQNQDVDFIKRMFLVTNIGILILKEVRFLQRKKGKPEEWEEKKCENKCPPHSFCPRGPTKEILIKFEEIESIINFPQLPQKLVILYTKKV